MRIRVAVVVAILASGLLLVGASPASAGKYQRACGVGPGDGMGYVNLVRVANMTCRHGVRVAFKVRRKFCGGRSWCADLPDAGLKKGTVRRNGWRCKVAIGYEFYRAKCRRGKKRFVYLTGA